MKHQPGPWAHEFNPEVRAWLEVTDADLAEPVYSQATGEEVCRVWLERDINLITAAPELLEVAQALVRIHCVGASVGFLTRQLEAAIDKAMGR